jgi:hypothetical protein
VLRPNETREIQETLIMPKETERKIASRGGAKTYRTIKSGGETFTCAITKKSGPEGGRSVCWRKEKK